MVLDFSDSTQISHFKFLHVSKVTNVQYLKKILCIYFPEVSALRSLFEEQKTTVHLATVSILQKKLSNDAGNLLPDCLTGFAETGVC